MDLMPPFKERGTLRRDSDAPGPPRLSVGAAVAPELLVRSRPRTVGSRALHLMRSRCLSHPGARAVSLPSLSHAPARARNAHDTARLRTHQNAQTRSAATSSPPPLHASSTSAAGAGGRGTCWWRLRDPDPGWEMEDPEISSLGPPSTRLTVFVLLSSPACCAAQPA